MIRSRGSGCNTACSSRRKRSAGHRTCGAVDPRIGHRVEPVRRLGVEIGVAQELAPVEEVAAQVARSGAPLCLWSGRGRGDRPACGSRSARETQELRIGEQAAAGRAMVRVITLFIWSKSSSRARRRSTRTPRRARASACADLPGKEAHPEQARVAEHDEQGVAHAPREADSRRNPPAPGGRARSRSARSAPARGGAGPGGRTVSAG